MFQDKYNLHSKQRLMIINKTIYFYKIRQYKASSVEFVSTDDIRNNITLLNVEISNLRKKLNKNSLPSFNSREKRFKEIETQKEIVNKLIENIDLEIKKFKVSEKRITVSVQSYFMTILKRIIIVYRNIQQDSLRKCEIYNEYDDDDFRENGAVQYATIRSNNIRKSIFNLTNTLLELKMAIKSQNSLIDRIDFYFDKSNFYLDEANKEISKIPGNYTGTKDMIIYFLLYLVCVLLFLVLIKISRAQ